MPVKNDTVQLTHKFALRSQMEELEAYVHSIPDLSLLLPALNRGGSVPTYRLKHEKGGFNIFRRFRSTHLEKFDCPDTLKHFWSGHAPKHVSERYVKLLKDREFRLE